MGLRLPFLLFFNDSQLMECICLADN